MEITDEIRRKISEGMKKSHERRKLEKANGGNKKAPAANGLLARLRTERAELDVAIKILEKRGVK